MGKAPHPPTHPHTLLPHSTSTLRHHSPPPPCPLPILSCLPQDPQDPKSRLPLIKTLKLEGSEWVSKYARGGSARNQSARTMYIAVDAVIGHLASNG